MKLYLDFIADYGTSPFAAMLAGVAAGLFFGLAIGIRLGKSSGYEPKFWKHLLLAGLVLAGGAIGYVGWHDWESAYLPSSDIPDYWIIVVRCLVAGGSLSAAILFCYFLGYSSGRRRKAEEIEAAKRALEARIEAERKAAKEAEAAAASRRKAEEEAAAARRRAEEEAARAELERQRRLAEEEARQRAEEQAARAREQAELERQLREQADTAARLREQEAKQRELAENAARQAAEEQVLRERRLQAIESGERKRDLAEKREEAEAWIKGYTATAVGTVLGTSWLPGSSTAILCTLEATMCYHIGKIYNASWTMSEAATAASVIGVAAFVGKLVAMEAMTFVPIVGWAAKSGIAAGVVWSMGQLVIQHFEELGLNV
jgi:uncharacterized protein (DUF697 family)